MVPRCLKGPKHNFPEVEPEIGFLRSVAQAQV
jgi:hypothetical protein